jgi:hypothetical protein
LERKREVKGEVYCPGSAGKAMSRKRYVQQQRRQMQEGEGRYQGGIGSVGMTA